MNLQNVDTVGALICVWLMLSFVIGKRFEIFYVLFVLRDCRGMFYCLVIVVLINNVTKNMFYANNTIFKKKTPRIFWKIVVCLKKNLPATRVNVICQSMMYKSYWEALLFYIGSWSFLIKKAKHLEIEGVEHITYTWEMLGLYSLIQ